MNGAKLMVAMLFLLAPVLACNATMSNISIGTVFGCPDGVPVEQAEVYAGEGFYLCGQVQLNGELLANGRIHGQATGIVNDDALVVNSVFSISGSADVHDHKYYYIDLGLKQPCEKEFEAVPLEVKTNCIMVPPSTIEAVPNIIEQGEMFELKVKNAPDDVQMKITGLNVPVSSIINKDSSWSQKFPYDACGLGSCVIHFSFTSQKHELCSSSADVVVTVHASNKPQPNETTQTTMLLLATLLVVVIGTAGAIVLNRYL